MDDLTQILGEVLRTLQAFGIVNPVWVVLAGVAVAVVIVTVRHLGLGALIKRWALWATPPPPRESDPMPMGKDGMDLKQKPQEPAP